MPKDSRSKQRPNSVEDSYVPISDDGCEATGKHTRGVSASDSGGQFDASFDAEEDVVTLRRVKRKANWLRVWKECPVPMDDLPARSREMPKKVKL